jgi:hypothetical protein
VWLPAGLSVNDLERIIDEIGAACWAREARITPVSGQAALVWVDIVRRDPLGAAGPLSPPVVDHLGPERHPALPPTAQQTTNGTATPATAGKPPGSIPAPHGRVDTTKTTRNNDAGNGNTSNTAQGTKSGAQADPPGVTGFGGVDVTDYV